MSFPNYKYGTGLSNAGSYVVSGKPYLSSSIIPASGAAAFHKFDFPAVTKEIVISCSGSVSNNRHSVRLAFSEAGLKGHLNNYFLLDMEDGASPLVLNVKATELYAMSDNAQTPFLSVYAALTGISVERVTAVSPSGSNWSGSSGVG